MRHFLDDRLSGGAIAALTATFVLMQVLFSAWLCTMTLTAHGQPGMVICHGSDIEVIAAQGHDDPASSLDHGCPCGTLCGGVAVLAPSYPGTAVYAWINAVDIDFAGHPADHLVVRFSGAPRFPTGPPPFSV